MRYQTIALGLLLSLYACGKKEENKTAMGSAETMSCESSLPSRFSAPNNSDSIALSTTVSYDGMVQIPAGEFLMGASDDEGRQDEYPQHKVKLNGFWMDATEVTNAQFEKFVKATGYDKKGKLNLSRKELLPKIEKKEEKKKEDKSKE